MRFRNRRTPDVADTLEAAEERFARGDAVGAIELLAEANRRGRDVRLEQRLVTMRDRYAIEAWFLAPSTYGSMIAGDGGSGDAGVAPRDQLPMLY
jgi:hypothetical protein